MRQAVNKQEWARTSGRWTPKERAPNQTARLAAHSRPFLRKPKNVLTQAGLLTYSTFSTFPCQLPVGTVVIAKSSRTDENLFFWKNKFYQHWEELTAAGTVPDLHWIPF